MLVKQFDVVCGTVQQFVVQFELLLLLLLIIDSNLKSFVNGDNSGVENISVSFSLGNLHFGLDEN